MVRFAGSSYFTQLSGQGFGCEQLTKLYFFGRTPRARVVGLRCLEWFAQAGGEQIDVPPLVHVENSQIPLQSVDMFASHEPAAQSHNCSTCWDCFSELFVTRVTAR